MQIIFTIAVILLFIHGQQIWNNHCSQGWVQAWDIEYARAGNVMIGALVAIVIVGVLEYFYWHKQDSKGERDTRILESIAKKLGIDESEYNAKKAKDKKAKIRVVKG